MRQDGAGGEPRGRAMRELGLRWRPLGYGALLVAALSGIALASREWEHRTAFQVVFWVKVVLFLCLLVVSYLHNFVLGPKLQGEIREGREHSVGEVTTRVLSYLPGEAP